MLGGEDAEGRKGKEVACRSSLARSMMWTWMAVTARTSHGVRCLLRSSSLSESHSKLSDYCKMSPQQC